ncbi:MAG: D-aminoacyl-tRNA deacylase [Bacteroidia bacterium]
MRVVIQRVKYASVDISGSRKAAINIGLLVLAGFEENDTHDDIEWICQKIVNMRIFADENGLMNVSLKDIGGDILLVSQFTLFASTKKGNRPGFTKSAKPEIAIPLYKKCITIFEHHLGKPIQTGEFGADMQVSLLNEGPVTIIMDSKNKE